MTEIALHNVVYADRTGRVSVEMFASDAVAWRRCCQLVAAGIDAQVDERAIEILA